MNDTALNSKVEAVFKTILRGRMGTLAVAPPKAEEMVARRLRLLAIYTQPGVPPELKEEFEEAIKLTNGCHETGQLFVRLATEISSLSDLSAASLDVSARIYLDAVRGQAGEDAPDQIKDKIKKLRDDVLRVLWTAAKDPSRAHETGLDILHKELTGLSDTDMSSAMIEASLLVTQVKSWRQAFETLAVCAQLGLICRGMLYRGLIETLGSRLERQASWEKFKEDLADVPLEAISTIPVLGDVIGKAKLIVDMAFHLLDKEKALEDEAADLATKNTRAGEFVELYRASILAWANWAVALQKTIADMLLTTHKQLAGHLDAGSPGALDPEVLSDTPPPG